MIICDSLFTKHIPRSDHPESPARVEAIEAGITEKLGPEITRLEPSRGSPVEIFRIHPETYVEQVKSHSRQNKALSPDTPISEESFSTARFAVGSALQLVEKSLAEKQAGFGVLRPPGHHAKREEAMGFCLFNNIAVAAETALRKVNRVAVVDIDVHHGNGTQEIFWRRADVLYLSFHQSPFYPGTGRQTERGAGPGEGFTLNKPLAAGSGWSQLKPAWQQIIDRLRDYQPEIILLSAGFDAHAEDPLGGLQLSDSDYLRLAEDLRKVAGEVADHRLVGLLEGGYNTTVLRRLVPEFIGHLQGISEVKET